MLIIVKQRIELEEIGLKYKSKVTPKIPWVNLLLAFQCYKLLYGDLKVPFKFIIPKKDSNFPKVTWGIRLGGITKRIRDGTAYNKYKDELILLGFNFG